jgi:hypothetical protein
VPTVPLVLVSRSRLDAADRPRLVSRGMMTTDKRPLVPQRSDRRDCHGAGEVLWGEGGWQAHRRDVGLDIPVDRVHEGRVTCGEL